MTVGSGASRVVVVVGGASGIGWASCRRFAAAGATVIVGDLDGSGAVRRAAELGPRAWGRQVQVTDEPSVAGLFEAVTTREGRLDAVVNCAGSNALGPVSDLEAAQWREIVDVCLTGAFLVVKHAARQMQNPGSIVTIASLNATQPAAGMSAYCSAKAGVVMLTKVAALELGARGIRVNAISPGLVHTPLVAGLLAVPGVAEEFRDNTPLGRPGMPDDVADAVLFLSQPGSWITGETLGLDGGAHTRRYPDVLSRVAEAATR